MKANEFEGSRALVRVAVVAVVAGCGLFAASDAAGQTDLRRDASDRIRVDCDAGQTIGRALKRAQAGDSIVVTGTCRERVVITTDRITLVGQGAAVVDGGGGGPTDFDGVVTIDGARGVTVAGLTIQNGPGEGILGRRGAAFVVRDTTVRDNSSTGIAVGESSTAEIRGCLLERNAAGIDVFTGSSAVLKGTIDVADNTLGGMAVNGTSIIEIRGAQVRVSRNGGIGVVAGSNSQLAFFDFDTAAGNTLTVDANLGGGIALGDSVLNVFVGPTTITVSNSPVGIIVRPGSIVSPFGSGTFTIENNEVGLDFRLGGSAIVRGGLNVRNNRTGVRTADGAGVLWFISIPPNPSSITGNGTDVELSFGARATFDGVAIGSITCDATVLIRGASCM